MKYPWKQAVGRAPFRFWTSSWQNSLRLLSRYERCCDGCDEEVRRYDALVRLVERRGGGR